MENIFKDKVILITGGTGFLGTHLIRNILKFDPQSIRIFSRDEFKHHKVQELFNYNNRLRSLIGDVRDYNRLKKAMKGVDIVIHAAALKRIDILEYNIEEVIKTNIYGTMNVVNACLENNVKTAVFVSTDKGCSPVNTYGASKFIGERIFTESNYNKGSSPTIFTCVRYGNVLESTGSVIPFFEEKIKAGEKIPLTDPRMTRFIISPQEGVELIFNAIRYGVGGEIFIPKIPSFKITDLIQILKEKHKADNEIKIIGIRPGEKIHELLINESEIPRTFEFKNMYVITSSIEKYQNIKKGEYYKKGKPVDGRKMKNYCSKDFLISKEEIHKIFKNLKLI